MMPRLKGLGSYICCIHNYEIRLIEVRMIYKLL
ncbi:hypothetical protein PSECIP111854_00910 [Pseudoalteromonas sp. CIP111854]|uniref:Uncharacterized protein n=1 Tax=Pseudoalteromonas holothuriae TaxID=2963714 RepID=A0A9W4QTF3_9GAMM|nr:hypothetical protein PSECIP111854_00910 [Pseudoalteromonas sp. CIP111854]